MGKHPTELSHRTTKRHQTFHDQSSGALGFGTVCHVPMEPAFCPRTKGLLAQLGRDKLGARVRAGGTVVTIEGPRFSSRAESNLFRSWGCDVVNMTTVPEVVLAAEAGIAYASVAVVTDYDCWRVSEESVDIAQVIAALKKNVGDVMWLFAEAAGAIAKQDWADDVRRNRERAVASVFPKM